jgi:hypothetical protein
VAWLIIISDLVWGGVPEKLSSLQGSNLVSIKASQCCLVSGLDWGGSAVPFLGEQFPSFSLIRCYQSILSFLDPKVTTRWVAQNNDTKMKAGMPSFSHGPKQGISAFKQKQFKLQPITTYFSLVDSFRLLSSDRLLQVKHECVNC